MIYLVSGYRRSGTSMMMQALASGGMPVSRSFRQDDRMNTMFGDNGYCPNDAYYELNLEDYLDRNTFAARFDGTLVKCLSGGLLRLPNWQYRIIFMRRPVEEIRKSCLAAFGERDRFAERLDFNDRMGEVIDVARDRRSVVSLDEVHYHDMLADPEGVLRALDWPVDPMRAATVPDRAKYRMRMEA